ncbi:hypothetical protein ACHAW6_003303 [Cyclotella cf. meneghiniana]
MKRDESMGVGTILELTYGYLLCTVGTTSRSRIISDSKQLWTAISKLEFARHLDVQEFYYESEEMQAQARARRQRRVWIAIVGGGPMGVELAGDLVDFNLQVCSRANGAFQHLMDDVVMLVKVVWNFCPPWMWI